MMWWLALIVVVPLFVWGCAACCGEQSAGCNFTSHWAGITPACWTTKEFSGSSERPKFTVDASVLEVTNGSPVASGSFYLPVTSPAELENLFLRALSNVEQLTGSVETGVFIGGAVSFSVLWASGEFVRENVGDDGESTGGRVVFSGTSGPDATTLLEIRIADSSEGAGSYDISFLQDGESIREETDVAITFEETFNAGVFCFEGGKWGNLIVRCTTVSDCLNDACPNGELEDCFEFVVAGVTNGVCKGCAAMNGVFILKDLLLYIEKPPPNPTCGRRTPGLIPWCGSGVPPPAYQFFFREQESGGLHQFYWWLLPAQAFGTGIFNALYDIPEDDFDCTGTNVLTKFPVPDALCLGWPATITIEPTPCN